MDINELLSIVTLKKIDNNRFEGKNYETVWGRVFGGQVLSQSLHAAYQTVPSDRIAHSMHGYFILPGNLNIPVTYEVDNIRNGGSFTTRRVVAFQNNKAIFNMAASFQKNEKGYNHQVQMPNVLSPDVLLTDFQQAEKHKDELAEKYQMFLMAHPKVFEFKPIGEGVFGKTTKLLLEKWSQNVDVNIQQQIIDYNLEHSLNIEGSTPYQHKSNN